jgi:uncharacterized SAM-binding protein YcdF (DUF218 family)
MFILKKVLASFLIPPGIFIIFIVFAGAWYLYKKNWKKGLMIFIFGCFMWLLSIAPVSDAMIRGLESEYSIPGNVEGDVIIILGHGVHDRAPDLSGPGALSDAYLTRIVTAVRLQKRLNIPMVVSGAEASKYGVTENHIAKHFITELGVPVEQIIIEAQSRDTFENAKFSRDICAKLDFVHPILVTSASHMKRAVLSFRKVGLKVTPFPTGFRSWQSKHYKWNSYLPGDFSTASIAIKEYLGLAVYILLY